MKLFHEIIVLLYLDCKYTHTHTHIYRCDYIKCYLSFPRIFLIINKGVYGSNISPWFVRSLEIYDYKYFTEYYYRWIDIKNTTRYGTCAQNYHTLITRIFVRTYSLGENIESAAYKCYVLQIHLAYARRANT